MREAARALDDVSDHLGEVLRHADELLAEWARFGAQVRTQVEREAAAIGEVVDGAVGRAASSGIDRAIADRLRALTAEIERIEQRARAASRAVAEQREADRRVLWIVVAGIVLANALLVALLLRKPEVVPAAEPIRIEATSAPQPQAEPARGPVPAAGSGEPSSAGSAAAVTPAEGSTAPAAGATAGSSGGSSAAGSSAAGARPDSNAPASAAAKSTPAAGAAKPAAGAAKSAGGAARAAGDAAGAAKPTGGAAKAAGDAAGAARPTVSPIVLPPKAGNARVHKRLP